MKKAILLIITFSAFIPFSFSQKIKLSIPEARGDSELHIGDWFTESFETYINVEYPAVNDPDSTKKAFAVTMTSIPVYNEARDFTAVVTIVEGKANAPFYVKKGESGTFRAKIQLKNLKKPGKYQCLIETTINDYQSTTLVTIDRKNSPKKSKSFVLKDSKPIYITGSEAKVSVFVEDTMNVDAKFNPVEITNFTRHFGDKEEEFTTAEFSGEYLKKPFNLSQNDIQDVEITINELKKAGKYTGKVQVKAEDEFSDTFDFTIYRRYGWGWTLGLIVLGIVLNYFILWLRGNLKAFTAQKLEISYLRERLDRISKNLSEAQRKKEANLFTYFEEEIGAVNAKNWKTLIDPEAPKAFKEKYDILTIKLQHLPLWLKNLDLYQNYASRLPSYEKDLKGIIDTHREFLEGEFVTKVKADEEIKKLPVFGTLLETIEKEEKERGIVEAKFNELEAEINNSKQEWQVFDKVLSSIQKNNLNSFFTTAESIDFPLIREKIDHKQWEEAKKIILSTEVRMKKTLVEMLNTYLAKITENVTTCNERYQKVEEKIKGLPEGEGFSESRKQNIVTALKNEDFAAANDQAKNTQNKGIQFIDLASKDALDETTIDRNFLEYIRYFENIPPSYDKNVRNIDWLLAQSERELKIEQEPLYEESKQLTKSRGFTLDIPDFRSVIAMSQQSTKTKMEKAQQIENIEIKTTKTSFEKIPSSRTVINQMIWQNIGYHAIIVIISCLAGVYVLWVDKMMWGSFSDILTAFLWGLGIQAAGTQSTPQSIKTGIAGLKPPA